MPQMNGTGPEGLGPKTGRRSGRCNKASTEEAFKRSGKGMGYRLKGDGKQGKGKRFQGGIK